MTAQNLLLAAVLSGTVVATIVNLVFIKRSTRAVEEIRRDIEEQFAVFQSQRAWKERAMSDLLGPILLQFGRTRRAFSRYKEQNLYLESKVLREGNLAIRDRLLSYGHLVPPELVEDADRLIEHYDRWLEEYERARAGVEPDLNTRFVWAGPAGAPFPTDAEARFLQYFDRLWRSLFETERGGDVQKSQPPSLLVDEESATPVT